MENRTALVMTIRQLALLIIHLIGNIIRQWIAIGFTIMSHARWNVFIKTVLGSLIQLIVLGTVNQINPLQEVILLMKTVQYYAMISKSYKIKLQVYRNLSLFSIRLQF